MHNAVIQKLIDLARQELGVREGVVNNTGARIVEYQGATWLAPGAWPWCAAFTCWLMRELLEDEEARTLLGTYFDKPGLTLAQTEKLRCRDASAFGWEKWAVARGLLVLSEDHTAHAGDFVVFDFSHIGLVIEDQAGPRDRIRTIEGNTNGRGDADSRSGDGVWEKQREPGLTKSYIRVFR